MNVFESELKKGRFVVGECSKCQKITWPPNNFCSYCFGSLSWRDIKEPGTIIEYSTRNNEVFCMAEFENVVRIMGIISNNTQPKHGQKIRIQSCGFDDSPRIKFAVVNS